MDVSWDFGPMLKWGVSRRQGTEGTRQEGRCQEVWAATQHGALGICALWGGKFHLGVFIWLGCLSVSSLWILSSLWELSSLLKVVFHLCYSRVSLHHSDRFCSLACWDITVSDPLCPAWLILQSACSEVTRVGDWNLTILLAFLISLASMRKQGNKCRSNEFSIN